PLPTRFPYTTLFRSMENTLGGQHGGPIMDEIIRTMATDPQLGIVFPDDPKPLSWDGNLAAATLLAQQMGVNTLPEQFYFPTGTRSEEHTSELQSREN